MASLNATQVRLIQSAYDVVSRVGLEGLSMRQVTSGAGVSSRLVYKYFDTKENFLFECYRFVDRQIAVEFDRIASSLTSESLTSPEAVKQVWVPYFEFVVGLGNQALYYYAYRDSSYIRTVVEHDEESMGSYFKGFQSYIDEMNIPESSLGGIHEDVLWTYVIDCTGVFAKRVIRGEIPLNDAAVEQIWNLISRGLLQG